MKEIEFYKMSGAGNDFILVDNRSGVFDFSDIPRAVSRLCRRRISIGADGLILIEKAPAGGIDFAWRFFNADGSDAGMCGNGARCAARLSFLLGISGREVAFMTGVGTVRGEVLATDRVRIGLTEPKDARTGQRLDVGGEVFVYDFIDTGVPHAVVTVADVDKVDVEATGRAIRHHEAFTPAGTNVNFISITSRDTIRLRTYERGVEGETLACGTGAAAAAITAFLGGKVVRPVTVIPTSNIPLIIDFSPRDHTVTGVSLEGDARVIYRGRFNPEALD